MALHSEAVDLADEYALTHRKMFLPKPVCLNPSQNELVGKENSALQFSQLFKGDTSISPYANWLVLKKNK